MRQVCSHPHWCIKLPTTNFGWSYYLLLILYLKKTFGWSRDILGFSRRRLKTFFHTNVIHQRKVGISATKSIAVWFMNSLPRVRNYPRERATLCTPQSTVGKYPDKIKLILHHFSSIVQATTGFEGSFVNTIPVSGPIHLWEYFHLCNNELYFITPFSDTLNGS